MNIYPRFAVLVLICLSIVIGSVSVVYAETTSVTVKENDTLSTIIMDTYPEYRNRNAIMQLILQRNPEAFRNNDINFLIVGKTLELPGAEELAGFDLSPASQSGTGQAAQADIETETAQRLQRIAEERDELKKQLQQLEADNQTLRDTIARLEQGKDQQDQQLKQLEQQLETLQSSLNQQQTQSPLAGSPADDDALAQTKAQLEQLEQLQTRIAESEQERQALQSQLADLKQQQATVATDSESTSAETEARQQEVVTLKSALSKLEAEKSTLQAQITELEEKQSILQSEKGLSETESAQLKQTLGELESTNKARAAANTELQEQIKTLQQDSDILRADNEQLQAELQAAKDQLVLSDSDMETLRTELDALDKKNVTLQSEIDQIKAAAAKDVTLAPTETPEQSGASLWPWLLMLFLLPVAWFLGQRSRPAPELKTAAPVSATVAKVASDPVIPAPLTRDEIDSGEFRHAQATIPDDPDVAIKLDMARAYLDLRNAEAANDVLQEVIREGGSGQQQEAKEMLSFIS
jgi:FimV-like protein